MRQKKEPLPDGGTTVPPSDFFGGDGRAAIVLLLAIATLAILGRTLTIPFFVIDDSDVIGHTLQYKTEIARGNLLKIFDRTISGARYWPGFTLYLVLRATVLGINPVLWHAWQILVYMLAGLGLMSIGSRITGSYWPGAVAHLLLISTGTPEYQSNWFSFVFTNSTEPLLYLLWVGSAVCALRALDGGRRASWWGAASILLVVWSILAKETTAPTMLVFLAGAALVLRRTPLRIKKPVWIALAAIAGFAIIWIMVVLVTMPKGASYAGGGTLVLSPIGIAGGWVSYLWSWVDCSYLFIPAALLLFVVRVWKARGFKLTDMGLALLLLAAIAQVLPLAAWPERLMRLSQPGYAFALLFACCEWACWFRRYPPVRVAAAVIAIPILVMIGVNQSSYMPQYQVREGLREKVVRYIATESPKGARVTWLVPTEGDIFAWSADRHAKVFYGRDDLAQGPHSFVAKSGPLRKGDIIVIPGTGRSPSGSGSLARKTFDVSGYVFPRAGFRGVHRIMLGDVQTTVVMAQTTLYQVESEGFAFAAAYEKPFLGAQ